MYIYNIYNVYIYLKYLNNYNNYVSSIKYSMLKIELLYHRYKENNNY